MENNSLKMEHVCKRYGNQEVLKDINVSIKSGEVVGLVGPNGAGKSTIMKIITGMIVNYDGVVTFNDCDIKKLKCEKKLIGSMIETPGFNMDDTGYDNLKFCSRLSGKYSKQEIEDVVAMLDMKGAMKKKVKKYSLGMKQRLGLCQSILGEPKLLILDEPTNGLDPSIIPKIRTFIQYAANERNMGVLVSSHILSEIEAVCSKVFFINHGTIVEETQINQLNDEMFVYETDMCQELLNYFASIQVKAVVNDKKVCAHISSVRAKELLPSIIQRGILIDSMYQTKASLENQYNKIILGERKNE